MSIKYKRGLLIVHCKQKIRLTMKILVLTEDWMDATKNTKFYLQDGLYFYKTPTETEKWISPNVVEKNLKLFRLPTAMELIYNCTLKNNLE